MLFEDFENPFSLDFLIGYDIPNRAISYAGFLADGQESIRFYILIQSFKYGFFFHGLRL